jgi:hypothetical protein
MGMQTGTLTLASSLSWATSQKVAPPLGEGTFVHVPVQQYRRH